MLSFVMLSVVILGAVMLIAEMLSISILIVIKLNVVMLSVVAPLYVVIVDLCYVVKFRPHGGLSLNGAPETLGHILMNK
jgi:hypothetical protein